MVRPGYDPAQRTGPGSGLAPSPGWPVPPPRPRPRIAVIIGAVAVLTFLIGAAVIVGLVMSRDPNRLPVGQVSEASSRPTPMPPRPTAVRPTPTASPTPVRPPPPKSTPKPTPTPTLPTVVLKKGSGPSVTERNRIYSERISGRCPSPSVAKNRAVWQSQVRALVACQEKNWRPILKRAGFRFIEARVSFYSYAGTSPCGRVSEYVPAFYCSANNRLYFGNGTYSSRGFARTVTAGIALHEYSHHVQAMTGILDAWYVVQEPMPVIVRRIELQAFCLTYQSFARVEGFRLTDSDRRRFALEWGWTGDPVGHGSVKAQLVWGPRGFYGSRIGTCNTWTVTRKYVT